MMTIPTKGVLTLVSCPVCGTERPVRMSFDLCPKCLLKAGIHAAGVPPAGDDLSGSRPVAGEVFGHYRLNRLLGAGGMGAVYDADDLESDRRVALKILSHRFDSPVARLRFLQEGRLAAAINHPHSVYVFGTGEIGGVPVIAMELIPGGTLEERIRTNGPMDVRTAVDATLQIIEGLDAAYAAGILHRDIKPSNCFIDADGAVKIGDFGLSIPIEGRGEPLVEDHGAFVGTPTFAAPEQLRGLALTVRSDIYAVGVTLFYMLTGRFPYDSADRTRLLAIILENSAPSPASYQPEIPSGLCNIIRTCLAKNPEDRFQNYDTLRRELVRFGTAGAVPAAVGVRFVAGLVDLLLVGVICTPLLWVLPPDTSWRLANSHVSFCVALLKAGVAALVAIGYFTATEGRWGLSPGKLLLRLRVVGKAAWRPGYCASLGRAAVFIGVPLITAWTIADPFRAQEPAVRQSEITCLGRTIPVSETETIYQYEPDFLTQLSGFCIGILLLHVMAQRRNNYCAMQDWLTGTRVVMAGEVGVRSAMHPAEILPDTSVKPRIGPYHVLEYIEGTPEWLLGYDDRLLRRVWIHRVSPGTPPVLRVKRDVGRVGRLRWLAGKRSVGDNWDAYEAVTGRPFLNVIRQPQAWAHVRFWLLDLLTETSHSLKEKCLPDKFDLHRVWITGDGRAKLFDFPVPGSVGLETCELSGQDLWSTARQFLCELATMALPAGPLPVHASRFLQDLPLTVDVDDALRKLREIMHLPVEVSRMRRICLVAGTVLGAAWTWTALMMFGAQSMDVVMCLVTGMVLVGAVVPAMGMAPFGGGMFMRLAEIAIVRADGKEASAARLLARSLMAWLPFCLSPFAVIMLAKWFDVRFAWMVAWGVGLLVALLSAVWPGRSLPDQVAGTCQVPR